MATPPVDIDSLQQFLNATSPDVEAESSAYLSAATDLVEARCGPMVPRSFTENIRGDRSGFATLTYWPVISVTTITLEANPQHDVDDDALATVLARSELDIGRVYVGRYRDWAAISYTAGRSPVPDALKLLTMVVAGELWEAQRGMSTGGLGAVYGAGEDTGMRLGPEASSMLVLGEFSRRAMKLAFPYLQKSFR